MDDDTVFALLCRHFPAKTTNLNIKNRTLLRAFLLLCIFLLVPSLSFSEGNFLSGYFEAGKSSTAQDYEEEGTDDDYSFRNFHLKLQQRISDSLAFNLSSFIYDKDYKDNDALDNTARILRTNWTYDIKRLKEEFLNLKCKLEYKQKHYANILANEYERLNFASYLEFGKKDQYVFEIGLGADDFEYLHDKNKNLFKFFLEETGKIYSSDKKAAFSCDYRVEAAEKKRENRKKVKQEITAGLNYSFGYVWLDKISFTASWAERDSKADDYRDEDYDYTCRSYFWNTEHLINDKLKTELKYRYFKKDYLGADLDHRGFILENNWVYQLFDTEKAKCWFDAGVGQKEVKYFEKSDSGYQKQTGNAKLSYQRKKNWKGVCGFEANFYDYAQESDDKSRFYTIVSLEKLFLEGDLSLGLDFKFRFTDYQYKNDKETQSVRGNFKYRF